jgi:hypothetical protein
MQMWFNSFPVLGVLYSCLWSKEKPFNISLPFFFQSNSAICSQVWYKEYLSIPTSYYKKFSKLLQLKFTFLQLFVGLFL